jgi:Lipase
VELKICRKTSNNLLKAKFLDPAHPTFEDVTKVNNILDSSDAEFVDVIHSSAGVVGHTANLGHADFWPNSGRPTQPGCDTLSDFFGSCSHGQSYRYFAESIKERNSFKALKCNNWMEYVSDKCSNHSVLMGEATPLTTKGSFYLRTAVHPSYAKENIEIKENIRN